MSWQAATWTPICLAAALLVVLTDGVTAQVSADVDIRSGQGSALVRSAFRSAVDVEVALWESDETGEHVKLVRPADVQVWPTEFRLAPGETQTVRFLVDGEAYPPNTLLRLETRFIPADYQPIATAAERSTSRGATARLRIVTRILSKAWIR